MDFKVAASVLKSRGFKEDHVTQKKLRLKHPVIEDYLYINKMAGDANSTLIIHPRYAEFQSQLLAPDGVRNDNPRYRSSNMTKFPKRSHKGQKPIPHGIPFGFSSTISLNRFVDVYLRILEQRF